MLPPSHPALGAFRKGRKVYVANWQFIADELAIQLRRRVEDTDPACPCESCLALRVYDEAKWRTRNG